MCRYLYEMIRGFVLSNASDNCGPIILENT